MIVKKQTLERKKRKRKIQNKTKQKPNNIFLFVILSCSFIVFVFCVVFERLTKA